MLNNVIMLSILVDRITMVEKDEDVAAVWQVILNGGAEWLADEIARADKSWACRAFVTIIKNQVKIWGA